MVQMSMSAAFEATADDVYVVLRNVGIDKTLDECGAILETIDLADVEQAALYGDDLDEQTDFAHQEIHHQLTMSGLIAPAPGAAASPG